MACKALHTAFITSWVASLPLFPQFFLPQTCFLKQGCSVGWAQISAELLLNVSARLCSNLSLKSALESRTQLHLSSLLPFLDHSGA